LAGRPPIYVEIDVNAPMDELWRHTQDPSLHERWDLRFTDIDYLPRPDPAQPQRFRYETRIGFGLRVVGEGESTGTIERESGERTSALRFWSDDPKSLIRTGSGYWKYVPTTEGIRFLTWYDCETRFGIVGRLFDRLVFRPLLGRATAWSFDRLRLWLEQGVDPRASLQRSASSMLARWALGAIWVYQGLVPKLLFPESGERAIMAGTGLLAGHESIALAIVGITEMVLGILTVVPATSRLALWAAVAGLPLLLISGMVSAPGWLVTPFNAPTLVFAMIALAVIGLLQSGDTPHAGRCRRRQPTGRESAE
jgi:uncharacterized membrane protein YphA (DoxX/SURF4 family)